MCFFRKRKERQRAIDQEKAQLAREEANKAAIVEEKNVEFQPDSRVKTVVEPTPVIVQTPIVESIPVVMQTPIVESIPVDMQKTVSDPTPVVEPAPAVEPKPVVKKTKPAQATKEVKPTDEVTKEKAPKIPKYHVSQNKDENTENFKKWRVRKEGSEKTIKFFDTQKDAIDYASGLAESAGSTVVIHKVDGSIRKQDYVKKP